MTKLAINVMPLLLIAKHAVKMERLVTNVSQLQDSQVPINQVAYANLITTKIKLKFANFVTLLITIDAYNAKLLQNTNAQNAI